MKGCFLCQMSTELDPGAFRITDETVRRPVRESFEPVYELASHVHDQLRAVERADQELAYVQLDAVEARRLVEEALTRNAYGTASIEGNPLTLDDVRKLLERGDVPEAVSRPEEREIVNHAAYMQDLDAHPPPRTPAEVLDLHAQLFDGVLEDAGTFKQEPNFIGHRPSYEVRFIPATPERVEPELANALEWFHNADEHPLVRVMVFFHEFQSIHPFRDGNGRAGRAIATLQLAALGYRGVRYALIDYEFNEDRDAYYENLSAVERQGFDYTPWISFMAGVLRRTWEGALDRYHFEQGLPEGLPERAKQVARWFARIDQEEPGREVQFADVHKAFPHVAERTLKRDLKRLREAEVVAMEGERKGARYRFAMG